ncbi:hypothetical protein [Pseudomonas sp. G5(2012)]|uniref:hypothetical protein n=1 Tax=Pseudomonas sp. G5(2012) TaxID=1268068 RepID=UPI0012DBDC69|nr:hypothetical protein [Pseudomonas sp. G5(2012)]
MRSHVEAGVLVITRDAPHARKKLSVRRLEAPVNMDSNRLERLGVFFVRRMRGYSFYTMGAYITALKRILSFLKKQGQEWPADGAWPVLIFEFYSYVLLDDARESNRNIRSSRCEWGTISILLDSFMNGGLIPRAPIPTASLPNSNKSAFTQSQSPLLENFTSRDANWCKTPLKKSEVTDLSYAINETAYFENLKSQLSSSIDAAMSICIKHWQGVMRSHNLGNAIANMADDTILADAIKVAGRTKSYFGRHTHLADPRTNLGLAYFLAATKYYFFDTNELDALNWKALAKIPFFQTVATSSVIQSIIVERLIAETGGDQGTGNFPELLGRAIGVLTTKDCAAAAAILIHEQPRFTPEALTSANIIDKNGASLLNIASPAGELLEFTIDKNRAKARKGGLLTKRCSEVLNQIVSSTDLIRKKIKRTQPEISHRLFLVASRNGCGHVGKLASSMNGIKYPCIFDDNREAFSRAGIDRGSFTLSHIRNSRGILRWLETGSVQEMAAQMGNTKATVVSSYLPPWLRKQMDVLLIRRFQQKTIILATADKKWQLPASDFETTEQLRAFIENILITDQFGNPYSDEFIRKFSLVSQDQTSQNKGEMYICISPETLAALSTYVSLIDADGNGKSTSPSTCEGLNVNVDLIVNLHKLILVALFSDRTEKQGSPIFDLMAAGSTAELMDIWNASRKLISQLKKRIKFTNTPAENDG